MNQTLTLFRLRSIKHAANPASINANGPGSANAMASVVTAPEMMFRTLEYCRHGTLTLQIPSNGLRPSLLVPNATVPPRAVS